jgi:hypothetical protein
MSYADVLEQRAYSCQYLVFMRSRERETLNLRGRGGVMSDDFFPAIEDDIRQISGLADALQALSTHGDGGWEDAVHAIAVEIDERVIAIRGGWR